MKTLRGGGRSSTATVAEEQGFEREKEGRLRRRDWESVKVRKMEIEIRMRTTAIEI